AVTEIEKTLNVETARRFKAYFINESRDIVCTKPGVLWNDASNLVTITKTTTGGPFNGNIASILKPDGSLTTFSYNVAIPRGGGGPVKFTMVARGQPDSLVTPTNVIDGTLTTTTVDAVGNQLLQTVQAITSGGVLLSMTSAATQQMDVFGRPTVV